MGRCQKEGGGKTVRRNRRRGGGERRGSFAVFAEMTLSVYSMPGVLDTVLVCSGCHKKVAQTGQLKQRN